MNSHSPSVIYSNCLVLEDNKAFCNALCEIMVRHGIVERADPVYDYSAALDRVNSFKYSVAILDIEIRNSAKNGFDVADKIRAKSAGTKIIMYTNHVQRQYLRRFMKLQLEGYALKNGSIDEPRDILEKVKQGKRYLDDEVAVEWDRIQKEAEFQGNLLMEKKISPREKEVIQTLCKDKHHDEIAKDLLMQPETLKKHIRNISRKLKNKTRAGVIQFAIACGIYKED